MPEWLEFTRVEQLVRCGDDEEIASAPGSVYHDSTEMARRKQSFKNTCAPISAEVESDEALSQLRFSLLLLSPLNDAIREPLDASLERKEPLAHWWTACSHNTYIVGDQLTGLSSADMYRRQLLQRCRHVEVIEHEQPVESRGI